MKLSNQNTDILSEKNGFQNVVCKLATILPQPQYVNVNNLLSFMSCVHDLDLI